MTVLLLALNEVNFGQVKAYAAQGKLPTLANLIARHGVTETTSEKDYDELEPWIQWVTAQTGLTLAEHGVFRLGDISRTNLPQIWDVLEAQGRTVGAISPMNAQNRCQAPAFFIPDPWTETTITASPLMTRFYKAVAQSVNENATSRITLGSAFWLALGLAAYSSPSNYAKYGALMLSAFRRRSWSKAMVLDLVLGDIFCRQVKRSRVDFASLFLNAAAHIQHHYLFNSGVYEGSRRNPTWYISPDADPLLEVYELYDRLVAQIQRRFPHARLMLATGLHQDPDPEATFYWRLRDHRSFLDRLGIKGGRVQPLMSRDFAIDFDDAAAAAAAEKILSTVTSDDGRPLFEADNRGTSLFVMLTWPEDIPAEFRYRVGNEQRGDLKDDVAFVAIKNGRHNGTGYLLDTGVPADARPMALKDLPSRIAKACGAEWPGDSQPAPVPI